MTRIAIPSRGIEDRRGTLASPATQWRDGFSSKSTAESWEIAAARRFRCDGAAMVVRSFSPADRWRGDFDAFRDLLHAEPIGDLWRVDLPEGLPLWLGWANAATTKRAP